ncbi:MAG TPA: hypothetical protein VF701_02815 [Thermoanaerobaculia bacterium]
MKRLLLILILLAPIASASDFAGHNLLVPVAGRTPGGHGSMWKTDIYVTNADRRSVAPPVDVTVLAGGQIHQLSLPALATFVFRDFTHPNGIGAVRIASDSPNARLTARARVYNVGSAQGEYGQTIPALPVTKLTKETYVPGLSGVNGSRTNAGVSNPGSSPVEVFVSLFDRDGEFRGGFSSVVQPRSTWVLNDFFSHFQSGPLEDATLQVTSTAGVYAYASVVRNDSGDADFIAGTGFQVDDSQAVVQPDCATPATLHLTPFDQDGWIVVYHAGTPVPSTTAYLAEKYGFTPRSIYEHAMQAFSADLTPETVAALRCEPLVKVIHANAIIPFP